MYSALTFQPTTVKRSPTIKLLYSANISLPFTRGYVHFNPRNHATAKYGFGPDVVFHWDNIGFDGPVIAAPRAYEIPDNTVVTSYNGSQVQNLGYQLFDGTTGKAAGIYNLSTKINSLTFQNVNTSGITSATLTMNAFFNAGVHTASTNWGISYRFNGGTWRNRNLTAGDLAAINAIAGAPLGQLSLSLDVPDDGSGLRKQHSGTASAKCSDGLPAGCRQYRFAFGDTRFRKPIANAFAHPCTHGGIFGEPDQHSVRQSIDHELVLDRRNFMHGLRAAGRERKRPAAPWSYRRQILRPTC